MIATWPSPDSPVTKPPRLAIVSGAAPGRGAGEHLLRQAVGSGKPNQALDAAERDFLRGALGDGHPVSGDSRDDLVEGVVVVELPAESGDVLRGAAPQQEAAFVVVEAEPHGVGEAVVEMHADGVAAEPPPVGELLGLDDDVAEVDVAEDVMHERASTPGSGTR